MATITKKTPQQLVSEAICIAIEKYKKGEKYTIIDASKHSGVSIKKISKLISEMCETRPKLDEILDEKFWPRNVDGGYIYVGAKHGAIGENSWGLSYGQYVLAEVTIDGGMNRKYYEMFDPKKVISAEFVVKKSIDRNGKLQDVIVNTVWVELGKGLNGKDIAAQYNGDKIFHTGKIKIEYRPRRRLFGQVDARALVSVNN